MNEEQILAVINAAFDNRERIHAYLSSKMPGVKRTILQVSDDMLGLPAKISRVYVDTVPGATLPSIL
jgi:hypothetical protein